MKIKNFLKAVVVGLTLGGMLLLWREFGGTVTWYIAGIGGVLSALLIKSVWE
jgi:hypothetical protein